MKKPKLKAGVKAKTSKPAAPPAPEAKPPEDGPLLTKNGRPLAITGPDATIIRVLGGLGQIAATAVECAAVLQISVPTLYSLFKRVPEAHDAWVSGKEQGKVSLRRSQFKLAEKNATMAIFLGMNLLDQKDHRNVGGRVQHEHTHTVLGRLLQEIDQESRGAKVLELRPNPDPPKEDAA